MKCLDQHVSSGWFTTATNAEDWLHGRWRHATHPQYRGDKLIEDVSKCDDFISFRFCLYAHDQTDHLR